MAENDTTADGTKPDEVLGDAGKQALDSEREAKRTAERTAKAAEKRAGELEAELQQYRDAQASDTDKAVAAAVREAEGRVRAELLGTVRTSLLTAKIEALAADRFADPRDAVLRLRDRFDDFDVDETSLTADPKPILAALDTVLTDAPHLARDGKRTPRPDPSQGALGGRPDVAPGEPRIAAALGEYLK